MGEELADGLARGDDGVVRCAYATDDPDYRRYHDTEWGRPVGDDRRVFEKICLEGFQAGLSWLLILRARDAYRQTLASFDWDVLAAWSEADVDAALQDERIVQNRRKVESVVNNAEAAQAMAADGESLAALLWAHEPPPSDRPERITAEVWQNQLARTEESAAFATALKKRGFSFVGPTTMYALMQSLGVVNDHLQGCEIRARCEEARSSFEPPR